MRGSDKRSIKKSRSTYDEKSTVSQQGFATLKNIDTSVSYERKPKGILKSIQLVRKAKRKLHKLKAADAQDEAPGQDTMSLGTFQRKDSILSDLYDTEPEIRYGLLKLRRSKDNIEANITELEKLLLNETKEEVDEEEEEVKEEAEEDESEDERDSFDEINDELLEGIAPPKKKKNLLMEKPAPSRSDFFEQLGDIPSLENISLDLSDMSDIELVRIGPSQQEDDGKDIGHFVDPLTGDRIQSSSSSVVLIPHAAELAPAQSVVIEEEEADTAILADEEGDDELDKVSEKEEEAKDLLAAEQDELGVWFEIPSKHIGVTDFEKFDTAKTDVFTRQMIPHILEFINQLFNQVVDEAQQEEPFTLLRLNLDKKKVIEELDAKLQELNTERQANTFLNKKVIDYFRRKKDIRALTEDPQDRKKSFMEKYNDDMNKLATLLSTEDEFKISSAVNISNLRKTVVNEEISAKQAIESLEKLIKKTFTRDHFPHLNELVTRMLSQMAIVRDEISHKRFVLIEHLHALAMLKESEDKLEDLGNGLTLHGFEHLQAETTNIDQKLEERSQDLNRLHVQRNKYLHLIAHYQQRHLMFNNSLEAQEHALQDLLDLRLRARAELSNQKFLRQSIRSEIDQLAHQGGLNGNTLLMLDYDKTAVQLQNTKDRVKQLRMKFDQLQKRMSKLELRLSGVVPNKL